MKREQMLCVIIFSAVLTLNSFACTIFTASSVNVVFAGNNEDMCTTNTEIHLIPGTDGKYGRIFWGFIGDENYQGGMNEHGLFFDGAGTPSVEMDEWNLPEFEGRYIFETILEDCKTVEEAIERVKMYAQPFLQFSHILMADANGDAVIFEFGDGRLNFLRKGEKNFLVATNFNITESENVAKECQRYNIAQEILTKEQPSVITFEKILSLTHQEGDFGTVYSNVCDLKNKKIYLYNFHNFIINKEIDLKLALTNGEAKYRIRDLFPVNYAENYFRMRQDCISDFENAPSKCVEFRIDSKTKIPDCEVFLRGSATELGRWNKEGIKMDKESDNVITKTISLKAGALIEFEVAPGNDPVYPVDESKSRLREMTLEVNSDTTIVIYVFNWKKNNKPLE
jgi:hypothetical protein